MLLVLKNIKCVFLICHIHKNSHHGKQQRLGCTSTEDDAQGYQRLLIFYATRLAMLPNISIEKEQLFLDN